MNVEHGVLALSVDKRFPIAYHRKGYGIPELIVMLNTHGREQSPEKAAADLCEEYAHYFQNMVVVPAVTPVAVYQLTRENAAGNDVNRNFFPGTRVLEARALMNYFEQIIFKPILQMKSIGLEYDIKIQVMNLHADDTTDEGYGYVCGEALHPNRIDAFRHDVIRYAGLGLFNQQDDPFLQNQVTDGVVFQSYDQLAPENGTFDDWFLTRSKQVGMLQNRVICLETPEMATTNAQYRFTQIGFRHFIEVPYRN